jgi:membrane-bound lytic murein transglycosylase D
MKKPIRHLAVFRLPGLLPVLLLICLLFCPAANAAEGASSRSTGVDPLPVLDPELFPVPENLQANVRFWTRIFTEYASNQVVLHDHEYLDVLYAVLDFSALDADDVSEGTRRKKREEAVSRTEGKYRQALLALGSGSTPPDEDAARRVEELFRDIPGGPEKYREAAERLRTQTGLKDRFAQAIGRSGRYMAAMEKLFHRHGVPTVLTRMAFVESMFQEGARSKVGAGGIWQLMPASSRPFLNIGLEADERFDPLRAAETAAQILAQNYRLLESWPLAVTGYNHGVNGMRRAVAQLGTKDPGIIFAQHKSRTFGFASRNFYSEFLAAAQAYARRAELFPDIVEDKPWTFERFTPDLFVSAGHLAQEAAIPLEDLRSLNPALSSEIWRGNLLVPKGYPLRVPTGAANTVAAAFERLPDNVKSPYQAGTRHRVRSGETLSSIARRYGTTIAVLQRTNKLRHANVIRIGQTLLIPPRGDYRPPAKPSSSTASPPAAVVAQAQSPEPATKPATPSAKPAATAELITHVVRSGDTLSSIARRYGTSVRVVQRLNGLGDAHRIVIGQRLKVPRGDDSQAAQHTVRQGETLGVIAHLYGTSVRALSKANGLAGHLIYPSQVLIIP